MFRRKHRRKKTKSSRKKGNGKSRGFYLFQNPLSGIPHDILLKRLIEVGKTQQENYTTNLAKVIDLIQSYDPLQIIATLSFYGLTGGMDDTGKQKAFHRDGSFGQSYVELVQAIALQTPKEKVSTELPHSGIIQDLFDTLPNLGKAFPMQRLMELEKEKTEQEKSRMALQEHLRIHTQQVRNWGYLKRVIAITKRLYEPINLNFKKSIGVSATELIDIFYYLVKRMEKQINTRFDKFKEVFRNDKIESIIETYYKINPYLKDKPSDLIHFVNDNKLSLDQVKCIVLSHSELSLQDDLTFTAQELSEEIGISQDDLTIALDKLSLGFGALANSDTEYFFLSNPVWTKPLISLDSGRYFCATPQVFFSFIFPIFNTLLEGDNNAKVVYQKRRAEFLEAEIESLFANSFPGCGISKAYKWKDGETQYENDLLVKVDSHLIVIEAKSGMISWHALRGAPDSAKRHIGELFLAPSIQSYRLEKRIYEAINNIEVVSSLLPNFPFSLKEIRTVHRLSVTLEDFAFLQTNLHIVKEVEWIPDDHPLAPCILLADLEVIFDILESTSQKIHYLKRRIETQANMRFFGDELDLLGFYLATGFNIGDNEFNESLFQIVGMSKQIDEYYSALEQGIQRQKPKLKLTKWWRDICYELELRSFPQWSDVANILLGFSFSDQEKAEKLFSRIKKNVHKNWRQEDHKCSIIIIPPTRKSDALALFAFRGMELEKRNERMSNLAGQIFVNPNVTRCVILGVNIDSRNYPYSTIAVFISREYQALDRS